MNDILLGKDLGLRENRNDGNLSFPDQVPEGPCPIKSHYVGNHGRGFMDRRSGFHQGLAWKG